MLKVDFSNASVQVDKYVQGLAQANTWLQEASGRRGRRPPSCWPSTTVPAAISPAG